ncbi:MAG: hypothetical protein WB808_11045 [Candidatus Dormiibacterota bacterium]
MSITLIALADERLSIASAKPSEPRRRTAQRSHANNAAEIAFMNEQVAAARS